VIVSVVSFPCDPLGFTVQWDIPWGIWPNDIVSCQRVQDLELGLA